MFKKIEKWLCILYSVVSIGLCYSFFTCFLQHTVWFFSVFLLNINVYESKGNHSCYQKIYVENWFYVKITTVNNIYTLPATILQTLVTIAYKSVTDHRVYVDYRHYQTFVHVILYAPSWKLLLNRSCFFRWLPVPTSWASY